MGLKITARAIIEGEVTGAGDIAVPKAPIRLAAILSLVTGVAAGQADRMFSDNRTLAANATEDLDLAGTGLQDAFGQNLTFAKVKVLMIRAASTNVNDVVVGGAAANGFIAPFGAATDKIKLKPGASLMLICDAGYVVTAATADLLKIANGGAGSSVTYDIVVVGPSA